MDTHTDGRPLSPALRKRVAKLASRDDDPQYADALVLDAYARISKSPETGDLEKTDRQLADILDNIERRHARLGQVLRDDNKSAWRVNAKRPDFEVLTKRLESGQSNGVVCWHTDRLMRQPRDLENLIDLSRKRVCWSPPATGITT